METTSLITSVLALAFVLALIGLINVGLKRFGPEKLFYTLQKKKGAVRRLNVEETLVIDARRRIVLVKCDKTEHLILLGATSEQIISAMPVKKSNA